jgi:hypothetical protein
MCIFTIEEAEAQRLLVTATRIFARLDGADQLLAYQMTFAAGRDVAMVLPIPVRPGLGDDAVRFIDLSDCDDLFDRLERLFPAEAEAELSLLLSRGGGYGEQQTLTVHRVGAFEASYVPAIADFSRLDRRFRLPDQVWDALPAYRDYGFAVFKLFQPRRGLLERLGLRKRGAAASRRAHPMAFAFPTRSPESLFFPTVHVHDGKVHAEASFDHELYCQLSAEPAPTGDHRWERGRQTPFHWDVKQSRGLLAEDTACFRLVLQGTLPNADIRA